jgi:hypothetical protein
MTDTTLRRASRLLPAVLIAALLAPAAVFARAYMTPGFRNKQARPLRIALLPPHADFIKSKVVMTDQMVAESAALEREGALAMKAALEAKGYTVRLLTPEELAKNPRLRGLVVKVNDRFGEEWGRIVYRPRAVRQKRYNAGEDAVRLASFLKVDGIAVSRIVAVGVTKGKAVMSGFANFGTPSQRSYARLDVGIVNGRHGLIEAFFTGTEPSSLGQLTKKPAHVMAQATDNAFRRYPLSTEIHDVEDADEPVPAAGRKGGDSPDDEAAIKDFEMLIKGGGSQGAKP